MMQKFVLHKIIYLVIILGEYNLVKCDEACKSGWDNLPTGGCFQIFTKAVHFIQAVTECQTMNATLATITNGTDQKAIYDKLADISKSDMNTSRAWIGLTDLYLEGRFRWVSGYPTVSVTFWNDHQPNDSDDSEDCVVIHSDVALYNKSWEDIHCDTRAAYVCTTGSPTQPSNTDTPYNFERTTGECPENFFRLGNTCFNLSNNIADCLDARKKCKSLSPEADLAAILGQIDQDYFTALLVNSSHDVWIGVQYQPDGSYRWVNQHPLSYTNWAKSQPYGQLNAICTRMTQSVANPGEWLSSQCDMDISYICESPLLPPSNGTKRPTYPTPDPLFKQGRCGRGYHEFIDACYRLIRKNGLLTRNKAQELCTKELVKENIHYHLPAVRSHSEAAYLRVMMAREQQPVEKVWLAYTATFNDDSLNFQSDDGSTQGLRELWLNWESYSTILENVSSCFYLTSNPRKGFVHAPCESNATATTVCTYYLDSHPRSPAKQANLTCPPNWILFNGSCYFLSPKEDYLYNARRWCLKNNSSMVSIHSYNEQHFVAELAKKKGKNMWLDLRLDFSKSNISSLRLTQSIWMKVTWDDGTPVDYLHFRFGEPSVHALGGAGLPENCVEMDSTTGLWNDVVCGDKSQGNSDQKLYVCKKSGIPAVELSRTTTTTTTPVVTTATPQLNCPYEFPFPHEYGCYKLVTGRSESWKDAEMACRTAMQDKVASLASIHNLATNDFILKTLQRTKTQIKSEYFWLGLSDLDSSFENTFTNWTDGTAIQLVNFAPGQQDNAMGGEDCIAISRVTGRWHDLHCSEPHPYICVHYLQPLPASWLATPRGHPSTGDEEVGKLRCPNGFLLFNDNCYMAVSDSPMHWEQANQRCKSSVPAKYSKRASLVVIDTEEENSFVHSLLSAALIPKNTGPNTWSNSFQSAPGYWIGVRLDVNDRMLAVDQEPIRFSHFNFSAIHSKQNNTCAVISATHIPRLAGYWAPDDCEAEHPFVCMSPRLPEKDLPRPPRTNDQQLCPVGFTAYNSSLGLSCYLLLNHTLSWNEARVACEKFTPGPAVRQEHITTTDPPNKTRLLSLDSAYELSFIRSWLFSSGVSLDRPFWLGIKVTHEKLNTDWRWVDGRPVQLTFWSAQPQDHDNLPGVNQCFAFIQKMQQPGRVYGMVFKPCDDKLMRYYAVCKYRPDGGRARDLTLAAARGARPANGVVEAGRDCSYKNDGTDYWGDQNSTVNGVSCVRWDLVSDTFLPNEATSPDPNGLGGSANHCRNPGGRNKGPYCFIRRSTVKPHKTNEGHLWDYCQVPDCTTVLDSHGDAHSGGHGGHSSLVAVLIFLSLLLIVTAALIGYCLWRRSAAAHGFIPYLRQPESPFPGPGGGVGGTSFHNPIYTPANC